MIKNFDKVKTQLSELSEIINKFNSESVQLKIVELLLGATEKEKVVEKEVEAKAPAPAPAPVATETETKRRKPGRPPKKAAEKEAPKKRGPRKRITDRPGPSSILKQLMETDFFTEKRTIGDIVNYCINTYKYEYKSTDLSGTLAKYAKEGLLNRGKNPESNQFEYIKP